MSKQPKVVTARPKSFAELLSMAQRNIPQPQAKQGAVMAQLDDGSTVVVEMANFQGDNGMVYGVRITGLGGKPKFFTPTVFARLFDPAMVEAAQQFISADVEESAS
jgi:hypothetical protein